MVGIWQVKSCWRVLMFSFYDRGDSVSSLPQKFNYCQLPGPKVAQFCVEISQSQTEKTFQPLLAPISDETAIWFQHLHLLVSFQSKFQTRCQLEKQRRMRGHSLWWLLRVNLEGIIVMDGPWPLVKYAPIPAEHIPSYYGSITTTAAKVRCVPYNMQEVGHMQYHNHLDTLSLVCL